jgi:tetratricopeptide (TPR) repeat protein
MNKVDLSILEDRANLFSQLRDLERICLSQNPESKRALHVLITVWNKVGAPLFDLGYWNDFFRCGQVAFRVANALDNIPIQAQTRNEMGWVLMEWEKFETAKNYFNDALQKYQLLKDAKGECRALRYLGVLYHRENQINNALECYNQALNIATCQRNKTSGDDYNIWTQSEAELHNMLGVYYIQLGDFHNSLRELTLSLEQYRSIEDKYYRYYHAAPFLNFGKWHFLQGNYNNARQYYRECLELSKEICRTDTISAALLRLAEVAEAEGKEEEALLLASEAERVAGTEITSLREEAAHFKEKVLTKKVFINKK